MNSKSKKTFRAKPHDMYRPARSLTHLPGWYTCSMANSELIRRLRSVLGMENVLSVPSELAVYDCDAYTVERRPPAAVVFPRSTQQVSEVVRICANYGAPIVARGAGTGLAGGCSPLVGGVVLMLTRMNRILEIRLRDALALVEPGVVNLQLTQALAGTGYHYARTLRAKAHQRSVATWPPTPAVRTLSNLA